ncbi:septum formation initiator [Bombiscardovia coagulans]|uniref:Septum formation initiator n=2 Tax=Bombiscardovia coagulans TaxID=686666 RepID=A0A261ET60_9BIFI|nr:septum formation initiator [Bombiscardovia coagulans]
MSLDVLCPWHVESAVTGNFVNMTRASRQPSRRETYKGQSSSSLASKKLNRQHISISLCISIIVVFIGAIQLISTFHTYAVNLSELNGLKNQQAVLLEQKRQLENDIARWDDQAYVTAQARDRLGFVFPGEQAIRVLHPEAVTGGQPSQAHKQREVDAEQSQTSLPWYREMAYSLGKADAPSSQHSSDSRQVNSNREGNTTQRNTDGDTQPRK